MDLNSTRISSVITILYFVSKENGLSCLENKTFFEIWLGVWLPAKRRGKEVKRMMMMHRHGHGDDDADVDIQLPVEHMSILSSLSVRCLIQIFDHWISHVLGGVSAKQMEKWWSCDVKKTTKKTTGCQVMMFPSIKCPSLVLWRLIATF